MASYAEADTYIARDEFDHAIRSLREMLAAGEEKGSSLVVIQALCELAGIKKVQGQLNQAENLYNRAYQWLVKHNGLETRLRCAYEFGWADLLRERNQLKAAHEHVLTGLEYRKRFGGFLVVGDLTLMHILQEQGDVDGALEALRSAEQSMQIYDFQLAVSIEFKTARVIQWLAVGDLEAASRWSKACRGGSELEQIALARLRLAQDQVDSAHELLDEQQKLAEAGGRTGRLIQILALKALAMQAQGHTSRAEMTLSQAIYLARPEGYQRVFLNLGWPLFELLENMLTNRSAGKLKNKGDSGVLSGYDVDLLQSFQQESSIQQVFAEISPREALADPLTDREVEVLLLLVEGLSNKQIAGRLVVAPSTIKQHLKNIYSKLDVHNRTQAVARAQELEIL
jgi:LuxR family maltose regulon positive regulatory protein